MTIVQYRDKTSDTGALISTAKALHKVCQKHNVPLLINDRVDVALAVDCEGVHVGQDDMSASAARKLLGPSKIIGVTVSSIEEARVAVEQGADYLGIGTLYATDTKKNTKDIIGINGIRRILYYLGSGEDEASRSMKTVCIGGINASNLQLIKHQLYAPSRRRPSKTIDGVALVSAIIASPDPKSATKDLKQLWFAEKPPFGPYVALLRKIQTFDPQFDQLKSIVYMNSCNIITHNMTNTVVQNLAASIALAIGASPIMSSNGAEAADLAKLGGGLVINMGTSTPESLQNQRLAIRAYNAIGGPVILDPVGAGATSAREEALSFLMASGYFAIIKGNEKEIMTVAKASGLVLQEKSCSVQTQQRGVDSGDALYTLEEKAYIVSRIASRERNIVLMTGSTDIISDGERTYSIANGHHYLGLITGSGCTLGTTLSAYLAANRAHYHAFSVNQLNAAIAAILHFEIAAEFAAARDDVKGPGTFIPAFVDELWKIRMDTVEGRHAWIEKARLEEMKHIPDLGFLKEL